jgi:hypothetical protein
MRWILVAVSLMACSEQDAAEWSADWFDGRPFLEGQGGLPERARVAEDGHARLSPQGAVLQGEGRSWIGRELEVVDWGQRVRVLSRAGIADVLLYLDRQDLEQVVAETTVAVGWPESGEEERGARLPGGLAVEVLEQHDRWTLVSWLGDDFEVRAWVEPGGIDQVYLPGDKPSRHVRMMTLAAGAELADSPAGEVFAWAGERSVPVSWDGEPRDAWVPVLAVDGPVQLRGWAHASEVHRPQFGTGSFGASGSSWGCGLSVQRATNVPKGTAVYDADGHVVARVAFDTWVDWDDEAAWQAWPVQTPWGEAPLWLPPRAELHAVAEAW